MGLIVVAFLAMLGIVLLLLFVGVGFIRRRRFSLKGLFALTALFAVLSLPIALVAHRDAKIPPAICLSFDGKDQWITEPMSGGDYRITLIYARDEPPLRDGLALRLFDGDELVFSTGKPPYYRMMFGDSERLGEFHAIEGHRYRLEVDAEQAMELARYHNAQLVIYATPEEAYKRSGLPQLGQP